MIDQGATVEFGGLHGLLQQRDMSLIITVHHIIIVLDIIILNTMIDTIVGQVTAIIAGASILDHQVINLKRRDHLRVAKKKEK